MQEVDILFPVRAKISNVSSLQLGELRYIVFLI